MIESAPGPWRGAVVAPAVAIAVVALGLRVLFAPQFDGIDDAGYLEAAQRVSQDRSLDNLFPLFRTRVGMAYPLGWLMQAGWLEPSQFWLLTTLAEGVTLASLLAAGWLLTGRAAAGLAAAALYAIYPLAVQQSAMFQPTAFQVASIALACALIAAAERAPANGGRYAAGFAAGLALGVGYLFKEDVAIVVPAIGITALVARFPRVSTAIAVGAGAALVFGAETAAYWQSTGQPLYRLTATSGLGAPMQEQLQIAQIWRWDAFGRSLLLLPVQVGLMWWLALPALWMAVRSRAAAVRFAAVLLLVVMAYLQFGSGSLSSYSPLPKTPRYTALATPMLALVVAMWLSALYVSRRRLAVVAMAALVVVAVPCLLYLNISSSERTRNTLAVLPALQQIGPAPLYTDYYSARILRLLEPSQEFRVWYHAKFDTREIVITPPPAGAESWVLLDRQAAKVYTSSYEMALPPPIADPPAAWSQVWRHRAYADGSFTRGLLEGARSMSAWLPSGNPLSSRIDRSIGDMIDGDDAVLYRMPPSLADTGR